MNDEEMVYDLMRERDKLQDEIERLRDKVEQLETELESYTSSNKIIIKKLPWTCGNCGDKTLDNIKLYNDGESLLSVCTNCGAEWVS